MNYQPLQYIYQSSGNANAYTLLLLHGTGGDETDLLPIGKQFGNKVNLLSLRGNVSEHGMPRFFKRIGMGIFDEKDLDFRTHEMVSFIDQLAEKEGFDKHKIIALGFSNGANIAGALLTLYPDFLAGAIMFRPMQPFKNPAPFKNTVHTPVFMTNGMADGTIRKEDTEAYVGLLKQAGFNVSNYTLAAGHGLVQQDIELATEWYANWFIV
ncbi:MAG: alpha/beta hydrolase [Agriterribacter sp.]